MPLAWPGEEVVVPRVVERLVQEHWVHKLQAQKPLAQELQEEHLELVR